MVFMIKPVTFAQSKCASTQKINGKNHCRKDELKVYRNTIAFANQQMINAAMQKDNEAVACWSKMIDDSQEKIFAIIAQEDAHSKDKVDAIKTTSGAVVNATDKMVNVAGNAVKTYKTINFSA